MKDITIIIPQRGGAVPEVWESLGAADINVEAAVSFSRENHRVVHIVVEDAVADRAQQVLKDAGVDVVTLGQYLQPTKMHLPVDRFVHPDTFEELRIRGMELGLLHVESGPLVRSSYHAERHVPPLLGIGDA